MTRLTLILLAIIALGGSPAFARQADDPGDVIARRAKAGDRLTVTTTDGRELRGRLVQLSPTALVLQADSLGRTVPYSEIGRVTRHKNGVLLGALIGTGAGFAVGVPLRSLANNEGANGDGALAVCVAFGLGIGIGIDAIAGSERTIYAGPRARVRQQVSIGPQRGGAAFRWSARW